MKAFRELVGAAGFVILAIAVLMPTPAFAGSQNCVNGGGTPPAPACASVIEFGIPVRCTVASLGAACDASHANCTCRNAASGCHCNDDDLSNDE
jgi:hypothetical protein